MAAAIHFLVYDDVVRQYHVPRRGNFPVDFDAVLELNMGRGFDRSSPAGSESIVASLRGADNERTRERAAVR